MTGICNRIKGNFNPFPSEKVGTSFALNFVVGAALSKGNMAMGVMIGGNCALATSISAVVKPVFMGLLGYSAFEKPSLSARFANNILVLSVNAVMMSSSLAAPQVLGMVVIASLLSYAEDERVRDPQLFMKLETIIAVKVWNFVKPLFSRTDFRASL